MDLITLNYDNFESVHMSIKPIESRFTNMVSRARRNPKCNLFIQEERRNRLKEETGKDSILPIPKTITSQYWPAGNNN